MNTNNKLTIIAIITLIAGVISMPYELPISINQGPIHINTTLYRPIPRIDLFNGRFFRDLSVKQGLDLQGGTQVMLKANMDEIDEVDREDAIESSKQIISRRIDMYGINEAVVQTSVVDQEYRIIVELPGIDDINQALDLIGATAQLDFRELSEDKKSTTAATLDDFVKTQLTGKNLKKSYVEFDSQSGKPVVVLQFDQEGATLFEEITQNNINSPVGIFLDQYPVTTPIVNEAISGGTAVISGQFETKEAKNMSIQLNAGALPVPIEIMEQRNIGATLGQESVDKSIIAGAVGLVTVVVFMILYYGWLGVIADIGLIIYGLVTLSVYKLIPITLTLPGLAGFILSVGMAVDSNILIFERMKEEKRKGKNHQTAMELGFGRAWDSIKDANVATLIIAFILFNPFQWNFLNTSGQIRGFALTLALGIGVSLFTGIFVTRNLMRAFYQPKKGNK